MVQSKRAQRTLLICMHRRKPPRVRCRRLPTSTTDQKRPPGDLRATNRQDSTDAPAMVASSISRIKKLIFPAPRKCPIDLFGPVANGRILKRLQSRFGCMLVTYRPLAACEARHNDGAELKYQSIIHCEHQSGHTATRSQRNDLNGAVCAPKHKGAPLQHIAAAA